MGAALSLVYGFVVYVVFVGSFVYAIAFVENLGVPKTIDSGAQGPVLQAVVVDTLLLASFAVQHSVMARAGFKRLWTRIVPQAVERSTYVLAASLVFVLMFWQWQPIATPIWTLTNPTAIALTNVVCWLGWNLVFVSTFLINHFELFGLRQVLARARGATIPEPAFRTPLVYRYVRHPIYLGFVVAFWATPVMSAGHLLFAVASTGYILLGIWFEERDLVARFGDQYRRYRKQVGMLVPWRAREASGSQPVIAERVSRPSVP
jgi:protein-S-isoprenylcysteine O-methyltransferase Ste14